MENKKEVTLDAIAKLIKESADETVKTLEAKIDASTEGLATMTQKHFLNLEADIKELKTTTDNIEANLNKKVDVFTHKDLEFRVEKLEEKLASA